MKKSAIWITVILFLTFFLRFWDLKNAPPGLWSDEAMNGVNTIQALEGAPPAGGWKVFYPENFGREGLFINIQAVFVKFLGHEPWVLRLPSAIFGVLTVLGLYFLGKELFGRRVGLFASFFLATSVWHIIFSRIGFRAIMAPLFLVWSFYFLFKGIRQSSSTPPLGKTLGVFGDLTPSVEERGGVFPLWRKPEILFVLGGLLFGLGFHTYIAFRIAPLLALYPLWIFYKTSNLEARLPIGSRASKNHCAPCLIVLFIFMAIVTASPLLIYYAQNPADFFGRTSSISIFSSPQPLGQLSENFIKTIQMFNFFGDFNWRHNYAGSPQLWWPVGILFLLGIWKALRKISNKREAQGLQDLAQRDGASRAILQQENMRVLAKPGAEAFILFWFFIMMLPVVISSEGLPHALRAIVLIPPSMLFAALGLEFIIAKFQKWLAKWKGQFPGKLFQLNRIEQELKILLFVFFIAVISNSFNQYFLLWAPNPMVYDSFQGDITKIAHWLNNEPPSIKKYVVTDDVERVDLTGSPISFQPIIFITDTYFENKQKEKNIYYLGSAEFDKIDCSSQCEIVPVESKPTIYETLKKKNPNLHIDGSPGFVVLKN